MRSSAEDRLLHINVSLFRLTMSSLAFLARSRTRAAGAQRLTGFTAAGAPTGTAISSRLDLETTYGFTGKWEEHSAQFNRPIQRQLVPFYAVIVDRVSPTTAP